MDKSIYDIKKSIKRDIKKRALSKEDQLEYYNCVYNVYGSKIYQLVTPNSIQKKDLCSIVIVVSLKIFIINMEKRFIIIVLII